LGLHLSVTAPAEAESPLIEAARADPGYSAGVQVLRRALAQFMNADNPAYGWLMIGRALGSLEQWPLAEQAFRRAVELVPEYAEAWAFLSEARAHTGGSGQPEMERALSLAPQSNLVNALNALALRRQARYAEALDALTAAARLEPEEPFWMLEIAATQVAMGDLIAAREYYQQAVDLAPENSAYWQALARFSVDYNVDMRGLGLPAARQAVMLTPEDPSALDAMGWTLANLDDHITGERFLQQALEIDPAHAAANLHLAQIYLRRQQSGEAYLYLKQAASGGAALAEAETARRLLQRYFGEDS
jgi:tetratricopeptide (TPR) repeat protein